MFTTKSAVVNTRLTVDTFELIVLRYNISLELILLGRANITVM